jgi:ABC-type multidrug transport system permease subunit
MGCASQVMSLQQKVGRVFCGLMLIVSTFFSWGQFIVLALGVCFLFSVLSSFCWPCIIGKIFKR